MAEGGGYAGEEATFLTGFSTDLLGKAQGKLQMAIMKL